MGINSEQFKQIMMIPQGEFRKMLNAGSEERQKVLQQLFNTGFYNMMQMRLDDYSKSLYREVKEVISQRDHEITRIQCEDDVLQGMIGEEHKNVSDIIEMTKESIERDVKAIKAIGAEVQRLEKSVEDTIQKREKARENNEKLKLKEVVKARLTEMEGKQADIDLLSAKLTKGVNAAAVEAVEKNFRIRIEEVDKSCRELEVLAENLATAKRIEANCRAKHEEEASPEKEKLRKNLIEEISSLKAMVPKVERSESLNDSIIKERKTLDNLDDRMKTDAERLAETRGQLEMARSKSIEVKDARIGLAIVREEYTALESLFKAVLNLHDKLESMRENAREIREFEKECRELMKLSSSRADEYRRQKIVNLRNQAAILAAGLEEGVPCPVCGSTHHPDLAAAEVDTVSKEELESLEKAAKEAEVKAAKAVSNLDARKENQERQQEEWLHMMHVADGSEAYRNQIEGIGDPEEWLQPVLKLKRKRKDDMEQKSVEMKAIEAQISSASDVADKIRFLEDEEARLVSEAEKAAKDHKVMSETVLREEAEISHIYGDIPENLRSKTLLNKAVDERNERQMGLERQLQKAKSDLDNAVGHLTAICGKMEQLEKSLDNMKALKEEAEREFGNAMAEKGFADEEDYVKAKMEPEELQTCKTRIDAFNRDLHALNRQHEELLAATKEMEMVDLGGFEEAIIRLREEKDDKINERSNLQARSRNNSDIVGNVASLSESIGKREDVYAVVGNLAWVAKGRNDMGITFERYVLAAFLEDIIRAANIRLRKMTGGRYELARTLERERRNAQGGLELEVFDNFTGKSRHVKTLSGGESFKASLSMALGLSDVVQSYAGGIQLDTMFIDEGFGTLDQESLDSAISTLIDLQRTGRLVGIISHVAELKERIGTRLEVISSSSGSSTCFVLE